MHTNKRSVLLVGTSLIAAGGIGMATLSAVTATAGDPAPVGLGPGMVTPSYPAVEQASPSSTLSDRTIYGLRDGHGVIAAQVSGSEARSKVSAREAQIAATSQFHFVNDGGRVAEVALAEVTTTRQGSESAGGKITPDLDHRVVWVVVFDHVRIRIGGSRILGQTAEDKAKNAAQAAANNAVMAVYVDPETGKVFGGVQW